MKPATVCPICTAEDGARTYVVRERMIGLDERFTYSQCARCGARRLLDIPDDLGRYYPDSYIAFEPRPTGTLRAWLRRSRNAGYFRWNLAAPVRWIQPDGSLAALGRVAAGRDERIVDVGCGSGLVLHRLAELGFCHLEGIDPFVPNSFAGQHADGVSVHKTKLEDFTGRSVADLVILNHVLEHVPDTVGLLRGVARLLTPTGRCLVRTPVGDSWAAEHYGAYWVQHDAPRHLVIHTERSLGIAAQQAGLRVARVWYDSTAFQFWGSEAYRRGMSRFRTLEERKAHPSRLLWETVRDRARAAMLNWKRKGDQACFVLVPDRSHERT